MTYFLFTKKLLISNLFFMNSVYAVIIYCFCELYTTRFIIKIAAAEKRPRATDPPEAFLQTFKTLKY
jgi:hypothetical protein